MNYTCKKQECTISELHEEFKIPCSTLYRYVNKWEKWGYVKKQKLNQKSTEEPAHFAQFKITSTKNLKKFLKKCEKDIELFLASLKKLRSQKELPVE